MGDFDFQVIIKSLPFLWQGLQLSLFLTFLAVLGGIVFGTLLALMRLSGVGLLSWPSMLTATKFWPNTPSCNKS
jgi:glutamate/aspartate transport system permease protein